MPNRARVNGIGVDPVTFAVASARILDLAQEGGGWVCCANTHTLHEGASDPVMRRALEGAALVVPDGAPVAWAMRRQGYAGQERVDGPGLMLRVLDDAAAAGLGVYLMGGSPDVLELLQQRLVARDPRLIIAGHESPPFGPQQGKVFDRSVDLIRASGASIVFVGLGAPKQEQWMARASRELPGVMLLGVGAAFDFHAGCTKRAPRWMQRAGLEWVYRLAGDPRRLLRRYAVANSMFVLRQIGWRREPSGQRA